VIAAIIAGYLVLAVLMGIAMTLEGYHYPGGMNDLERRAITIGFALFWPLTVVFAIFRRLVGDR
jgi:hypothetical protein